MPLLGAALSRLGLRTMNHAEARRLDVLVVHALPASVSPTVTESETETETESETRAELEKFLRRNSLQRTPVIP